MTLCLTVQKLSQLLSDKPLQWELEKTGVPSVSQEAKPQGVYVTYLNSPNRLEANMTSNSPCSQHGLVLLPYMASSRCVLRVEKK